MSAKATITGLDPATGQPIAVDITDGRIAAIRAEPSAQQLYLAPGLIDLQVNGYGGIDLNADGVTPEQVLALTQALGRLGVTTFLPTLITGSEARIIGGLKAIGEARRQSELVRHAVPFVHVEGPSISPMDGPRGAHPLPHVRAPSLAEFTRWQDASDGLVGLVTLAPEYGEAPDYIRALSKAGVVVALGHSAALPEHIEAAAAAGALLSTHLGNGAAAMLPRHPNFIWSQLADDRLTATFITDGHHLPAATFKAMLRAKGLERAVLVSDSVSLGGMPPGRYEQPVGGTVEVSADGRIGVADTPYLAGAGMPLNGNVAMAIRMAGLSLADGLRLATANPGKFVGGRGRLKVGAAADLIRFAWQQGDTQLHIESTFSMGRALG
ncbi:MAG TPA: amidohydrolase family protein [Devosia sp.]|nr:amidohydrolase family protein [Devosia sp.]